MIRRRMILAMTAVVGLVSFWAAGDSLEYVRGGQFKDLILPMPIINGLESEGIWGNSNVVPRDRDNGMEDNQWCYWGGNPILGKDGKYHIAVCRWAESTGHGGWMKSEVAHCVSDNPIGPYRITGTIVKEGHNPEVLKLGDGQFALHLMNNRVYTADRMAGPWTYKGTMRMDARGFRESNRMGSNLTTEYRQDGSVVLMKKDGDIAISKDGILGPYRMVSTGNYSRATGYPEDPVIWKSRHQYHCVYNHAQDRRSAYMRSLDGIHWKNEYGLPYDASTTFYTDGSKNTWYKFERPKVLQDELGRATHLSLAVMDVSKGADKGNDTHSSKNMIMPLVKEKLIEIVSPGQVTAGTRQVVLKIEGESDFEPAVELDRASLRLGSDGAVNFGGGYRAVGYRTLGKDLEVTFEGENGLTYHDYDMKLIGQTKSGGLVIGYALLPGRSSQEASLIALKPQIKRVDRGYRLESVVENDGLSISAAQKAGVIEYRRDGWHLLGRVEIGAIKPYGSQVIGLDLKGSDPSQCDYAVLFAGSVESAWRMMDHTDPAAVFEGQWQENSKPSQKCFLGGEKISETFGDRVTLTFEGTRARVYGRIGRGMGSFKVSLDGTYLETIRCNYAPVGHVKLFQTPLLSEAVHTLELVKVKTDMNGEVAIDSFAVESESYLLR